MNRSLPRLFTGLLVIPAALVLVAAKLTSGATSTSLAIPLPGPAFDAILAAAPAEDTAYFAGGCFWGVEGVFEHVKGVKSAVSGYSGGAGPTTYVQVTGGDTGHAETVQVIFDPAQISYGQLLRIFFSVAHDPTQLNRQGPDRGTQYRSAIFFNSGAQQQIARSYVDQLTAAKFFPRPIVTQLAKLRAFYPAEEYHQDYMVRHPNQPYIVFHDAPKVAALKKQFADIYRD